MGGNPNKNWDLALLVAEHGTQDEVARLAGIHPSTLNQILNRRRSPSSRTVRKLAEVLDCDMALVLGDGAEG